MTETEDMSELVPEHGSKAPCPGSVAVEAEAKVHGVHLDIGLADLAGAGPLDLVA
jgi:hypothetical protein